MEGKDDMTAVAHEHEQGIYRDELNLPEICFRELSHDEIKRSILNCQLCPMHKLTKPLPLNNFHARFMILGEKPEDVLFETPQGKMLAQMIRQHRIDLQDVYLTALIKCQESNDLEKCQHHLIAEIMTVRPLVVLCLGYSASKVFDPNPQLGRYAQIYPNVYVVSMYSFRDAMNDNSGSVLQAIGQQFAYISTKLQELKTA
jgi:uracil-DNA glycosylase family 4